MSNCYRPTTLKLASAHCPRAVDYYEQNRPMFREHFQVGIAAHECLAGIGVTAQGLKRAPELGEIIDVCQGTVRALITKGRAFEDRPEPPMPMEDAREGADLALRYATSETTTWNPAASYERGIAFDASWRQVGYNDPTRRFRLILDVAEIIEDAGEEYSGRVAVVRDYKSAWSTDAGELATYQMKAQAVAAWLTAADVDCVRREVVNLRSGALFNDDLWLESGGKEQLEEWCRDITFYMQALDEMIGADGLRPARPCAGCLSCPWSLQCDDSIAKGSDAYQMAQRLALIDGQRAQLIKSLKEADPANPMIFGDSAVGWRQTSKQAPIERVAMAMFEAWQKKNGDINGFLAALLPGMGALRAVAKRLEPEDKEAQEGLVTKWSKTEHGREFKIWRAGS